MSRTSKGLLSFLPEKLQNFFDKEENDIQPIDSKKVDKILDDADLSILVRDSNTSSYKEKKLSYIENIREYHKIASSPYGDNAIQEIVNEMYNPNNNESIQFDFSNIELSKQIITKLQESGDKIVRLLDFNNTGNSLLKSWYINGLLLLEPIYSDNLKEGIQHIAQLKTNELIQTKDKDGKTIYKFIDLEDQFFINAAGDIVYNKENLIILTSGYTDFYNRNIGFLHSAIKAFNQVQMIEDIIVIYRLSRGSEKRIFKINVGKMSTEKARNYINKLISKFSYKKQYNANDGSITNDSHLMSISEDYWLPTKNGTKDIDIDTLSGGMQLGEITDLDYFVNKLYNALKVPLSRFKDGTDVNDFTATEVNRDEGRFLTYVEILKNKFNYVFIELLKREVLAKNIMTNSEFNEIKHKIKIKWPVNSTYLENLKLNKISKKIDVLNDVKDYVGKYFSNKYIINKILDISDEEFDEMRKQIKEEEKDELFKKSEDDY